MANKWKKSREKRRRRHEENIVLTKRVRCGSDLHTIGLTKKGTVVLFNHDADELDQAQTLEALGHQIRCLEISRNWYVIVQKASENKGKIPRDMFYDVPRELHNAVRERSEVYRANFLKNGGRRALRAQVDLLALPVKSGIRIKYFLLLAANNVLSKLWPDDTFVVRIQDDFRSDMSRRSDEVSIMLHEGHWREIAQQRLGSVGGGFCLGIEKHYENGWCVVRVVVKLDEGKFGTRNALIRGREELSWAV